MGNREAKTKLLIGASLLSAVLCGGCDHVPSETFKIKTVDGKEVAITCPVVDRRRNELTYFIDGNCVIEIVK